MHYKKYKSILSAKNGVNLYRGCLHGCIYCDSRSECYQFDHDFEDIEVKEDALKILRDELTKRKRKVMISTGSMTDPYMPIEHDLRLTRGFLELAYELHHGASVLTKSASVLRDLDIAKKINERSRFVLQMTLTTADENLCKILEPNVSSTIERVEALRRFSEALIDTVVWITPICPFINDTFENIDKLIDYCIYAKVKAIILFDDIGLTLRKGDREYFYRHLDINFPGLKDKYMETYGNNYVLSSQNRKELLSHVYKRCKEVNILVKTREVFAFIDKLKEPVNLFSMEE